ncbi:hypothetical protein N7527_011275 [Penicillium freii]|nr:hypothetical protein N7527_011275 [Penicillium freii]
MSEFPDQNVDFLGLEWAKLEIGLWLYFHLPRPLNDSITKEVCENIIMRELPYDELFLEIELRLPDDVSSDSAAALFFGKIGTLVVADFLRTSSSMDFIRTILCGYLNQNREKIEKYAKSLKGCSDTANESPSPLDCQNDRSKQNKGALCIKAEYQQPSDSQMNMEQIYDDHVYTTALKELALQCGKLLLSIKKSDLLRKQVPKEQQNIRPQRRFGYK